MDGFWRSILGEWKAILAVTLLAGALMMTAAYKTWGPAAVEAASVVRFGSYADEVGNHPTVIVRLNDGSTQEITASPGLLRGCAVGANITLIRRTHSLQVDPRGCR